MPITDDGISSGHRLNLITQEQMNAALANYMLSTAIVSAISSKMDTPLGLSSQYVNGTGALSTFPAIPAAQVNSDWLSNSGLSQILNKPVKYTGTTNGSGIYAVTYAVAYSVKPHVVLTVEGGTNKDTEILTSSTTGFSIMVERRTDVLGLLPSYAAVSGLTVNVTVTP